MMHDFLKQGDLVSEMEGVSAEMRRRRAELEARIESLIELLDMLDGDSDLEPYLAGGDWPNTGDDREDESELLEDCGDTEANGDEGDYSQSEDDGYWGGGYDGTGAVVAEGLINAVPTAARKAQAFANAALGPILYDLRRTPSW